MNRMTIGQLKQAIKDLPDDGLVVLESDSAGNESSTLLGWDVVKVGEEFSWGVGDEKFVVKACEETYGVDLDKDKDKTVIILQPSL